MNKEALTEKNISIIRSFYEGGTDNENTGYGSIFHPDFTVTAPDYLPWGGTSGLTTYLDDVLPQVTRVIDFKRLTFDSIVGQENRVVVVINVGVVGFASLIKISEHWEMKDGKALSLWVAYFEPQALLDLIELQKVLL
jgi:hypothetical protein